MYFYRINFLDFILFYFYGITGFGIEVPRDLVDSLLLLLLVFLNNFEIFRII